MHFLDLTLPTLEENLALEEALLLQAEAGSGGEVLRIWEWQKPAVVLGSGRKIVDDVDESACAADGVPILRRSSGGGTVLLGKGCLLFSLVLAYERSVQLREIPGSYRFILGELCRGLEELFPGITPAGTSDLAIGRRKCSGNSQQRKHRFLLHHGTLLYDYNIHDVGRYLLLPRHQRKYRGGRSHEAFLMNLPAGAGQLQKQMRKTWEAEDVLDGWPKGIVEQLAREKYSNGEWIRRR